MYLETITHNQNPTQSCSLKTDLIRTTNLKSIQQQQLIKKWKKNKILTTTANQEQGKK